MQINSFRDRSHPHQHQEKIGLLYWNCCRNPNRCRSLTLQRDERERQLQDALSNRHPLHTTCLTHRSTRTAGIWTSCTGLLRSFSA